MVCLTPQTPRVSYLIRPQDSGNSKLLCGHITAVVIRGFRTVYDVLGPGFPEHVYRRALAYELRDRGLRVVEEAAIDVWYRGIRVGYFRADLLVENQVIVELKAASGSRVVPARARAVPAFQIMRSASNTKH
jgi:GxxExxY protein